MANRTLLGVVSEAVNKGDNIDDAEEKARAAMKEALKLVKPEFHTDFSEFIQHVHMPDAQFLAYWESDEDCQRAMKLAFGPLIATIEEMQAALRDVANWSSSDLHS